MKTSFEFKIFMPYFGSGEVNQLTGVSAASQRDWRRRGYLPKSKGNEWARFDPWLTLVMLSLKLLSDRGVAPRDGLDFAVAAGTDAFWHCLQRKAAYAGGHEFTLQWLPEASLEKIKKGLRVEVPEVAEAWKEFAKIYRLDPDMAKSPPDERLWWAQADHLARQVFAAICKSHGRKEFPPRGQTFLPTRFLIWRADGTLVRSTAIDTTFEGFLAENYAGATIVLDVYALASEFLARVGRPLVEVKYHLWLPLEDATAQKRERVPEFIPNAELISSGVVPFPGRAA